MSRLRNKRPSRAATALALTGSLNACASIPRAPYMAGEATVAKVAGIPSIRAHADASVETFTAIIASAVMLADMQMRYFLGMADLAGTLDDHLTLRAFYGCLGMQLSFLHVVGEGGQMVPPSAD